MKKLIIFFVLLPIFCFAQEKRNYFTNLTSFGNGVFALSSSEKPKSNAPIEPEGPEIIPVVYPVISDKIKDKILVCYSDGPSADPQFVFYKKNEKNEFINLCDVAGEEIYFPGNGSIYVLNRSNQHFTKRRKYIFENNMLQEIPQAFYFVGLKTKTLKTLQLYSDFACTKKMADVAIDSEIEVLASEFTPQGKKYLVKTPFGLVGWWILDKEYPMSEEIDGINYQGD